MEPKLLITKDGSPSFYLEEMNETYHSKHGAKTETLHVFVKPSLSLPKESLRILEVGLGTGSNAWHTAHENHKGPNKNIFYDALEPFPLAPASLELIRPYFLNGESGECFDQIHQTKPGSCVSLMESFHFSSFHETLQDFVPAQRYNVIYFDAFGPRVQEEMWNRQALEKCKSLLEPSGIWLSYCSKGSVKRELKELGFEVVVREGPTDGKREVTMAICPS